MKTQRRNLATILYCIAAALVLLASPWVRAADPLSTDTVDQLQIGNVVTRDYEAGREFTLSGRSCYKYTRSVRLVRFLRDAAKTTTCKQCIHALRYAEQYNYDTGRRIVVGDTCWTYDPNTDEVLLYQDNGKRMGLSYSKFPARTAVPTLSPSFEELATSPLR